MKIQPINYQQPKTSFKSAFPVVHWVAETNGSYAPVANLEIVKQLQGKIIRMLNKPLAKSKKTMDMLEQRLRAYLGRCDIAYRNEAKVRSFYNKVEAYPDRFTPTSYIITGRDVDLFNEKYAKDIGRAKGDDNMNSVSVSMENYSRLGLNFVKDGTRQLRDSKGMPYMLHTKFEIIRNTIGKIKGYKFIEARFLPVNGQENNLGKM